MGFVYVGLFSRSYDALCRKGFAAAKSGNFKEAEHLFLKAIAKDPKAPAAYAGLGLTYQELAGYHDIEGDRERLGELSVSKFDEAIRLQTIPEVRADYWWQRAITLGLLNRTAERDQSWREADEIVPGFTVQRNDRSAWMDKRTCDSCGKPFTLSDHANRGAWAAAESLQRGTAGAPDETGANYFTVSHCPIHAKQVVEDLLAESMKMQAERDGRKRISE